MNASTSMPVRRLLGLAASLTLFATFSFCAPPVLRWNDAAGTNVWNATETDWLDAGDLSVAWQPGAEAHFTGAGGAIQLETDVSAVNLAFAGTGYTLLGAGRLALEGTVTAAEATANSIGADLLSVAGITKTGAGSLTLSAPSAALAAPVAVAQGALALQGVAFPGALSVAAPGALAVLPAATNGLMGFYYNVASSEAYNFTTLALMEAHFAALTPNLVAPSSLAGAAFDFGADGARFPAPYTLGDTRAEFFEAVWRGTLTAPASTWYTFRLTHDDGFLLAFDGKLAITFPGNSVTEGTAFLEAGPHDMVLGLFQGTGPAGMQVEVKALYGSFALLPNAWLAPYASVGALSGNGAATLSSGAAFNVAQKASTAFSGELAGPAGALFTKSGPGSLTLTSASAVSNAFAGDVAVQGGVLALSAAERIGDASTVAVAAGACLRLAADETLGALSGAGTVTLGGGSSVFVVPFTGDADSGIATNKTYTHKLDFPEDGLPATVNDVAFTAAGMNGSADGYSWSTVNPPTDNFGNAGSGVGQLLSDFYYGRPDYTLTLSGLRPGQAYETRLYFGSYGAANPDAPRKLNFAFTAGAAFVGAVDHNPDTVTRSWVSCRYTADAAGTLSVHVLSYNSFHTCHLYGLSNEETAAPAPAPATTTWPSMTAFAGDEDSGISAAKTYTHKLDFPTYAPAATVNGVTFTAAGMDGSADGYSWSTVNPPPNAWGDAGGAGVENLLWDFFYDSTDFTLTLSGLHPGQTYETRIYFRSFGGVGTDTPRDITVTFTAGANLIGSIDHDIDTLARSRIDCRYTADDAGTVSIRVFSYNSGSSCHFYGISNEEVNAQPRLTVSAPAGSTARHTGVITGYGLLVKQGEGTQVFGGANSLAAPLEVQAGMAAFEPGASVHSGAVVRAGATLAAPSGDVRLGGLAGAGTFSLAGLTPFPATNLLTMVFFSDDAGTGISAGKAYTHKLDFGTRSPAAVINGVAFDKVTTQSGAINGYGWVNFPPSPHGGDAGFTGVPVDSGIYNLLFDMAFGYQFPGSALMQLTGLTPGKRYEVHFFNRAWGWDNDRTQTLTFDPDGEGPVTESITFNPDMLSPNFVAFRYTAASPVLNITLASKRENQSLHLYGLSNEEVTDAVYVPVTVDITKDSVLSGPVTGAGGWAKTGAATFTLTGAGTATGPLAVGAGALGVAEGGCATLGPVSVAEGATLFGDGAVGGNVAVGSNAWLMAGSATACGTLQVGGALTLAQGARLAYHFGAGSDTVTVGGTLTFPASGVVQASAVTPGASAPAKDVFFASAEAIVGPADLNGWTVEGVDKASLMYSDDRKTIYFSCPRGTLLWVQ